MTKSSNPKIGIISQARMTSTRLPGKVLLPVMGHSLLQYHLTRLSKSKIPVYVATTDQKTDEPIVEEALRLGFDVFRGSETDVLGRYYESARFFDLDIVIRVTSDCPLIDASLISESVELFQKSPERTYLSNCLKRSYPRGFDFEIFSKKLLEEAYWHAKEPFEREHVTPYMYLDPQKDILHINQSYFQDKSHYRITVDTPEDFLLIKTLIEAGAAKLSYQGIIDLLDQHPDWIKINSGTQQKKLISD